MCVDHYMSVGSLLYGVEVMFHLLLAVVVLPAGNDIADISAFHRIIPIAVHQVICRVHMPVVVVNSRRRFVVHHQFDAFGVRVIVKCLYIEVRIRSHKIEYEILLLAEPVFPTGVPPLYKELVEAIVRCEIYISAHVPAVRTVSSVWFSLGIVECREVKVLRVGIAP